MSIYREIEILRFKLELCKIWGDTINLDSTMYYLQKRLDDLMGRLEEEAELNILKH